MDRAFFRFATKLMAKNWWCKFEYGIWQSDTQLGQCSLAARGFWLEILCAMYDQDVFTITGTFQQLARIARCDSNEVAKYALELKDTNAANVTLGHGNVTLMSRRLKRELNTKEKSRLRKQKERSHAEVTPQSKSKSLNKEKKIRVAATTATDSEWLNDLKTKAAYKRLDVDIEFDKAEIWAEANNRQCTRRFFVGWLNRAKPMEVNNGTNRNTNGHKQTPGEIIANRPYRTGNPG